MEYIQVTRTEEIDHNKIYHLWNYRPQNKGNQDEFSKMILILKELHKKTPFEEKTKEVVNLFAGCFSKYFLRVLTKPLSDYTFCLVPSHLSTTDNKNGVYMFSRWCKSIRDNFDKDVIIRHHDTESLHGGGNRSIDVHLNSLKINKNVKSKKIVVIDDVTTTGNSLYACKKLLEQAGAKEVILFSFGKTY